MENIEFKEIAEDSFLSDFETCEALICTAGNQMLGEASYLGKPVLALPEPNNQEQMINAFFAARQQVGEWCQLDKLTYERLNSFLRRMENYRSEEKRPEFFGNDDAIRAINGYLRKLQKRKATPK